MQLTELLSSASVQSGVTERARLVRKNASAKQAELAKCLKDAEASILQAVSYIDGSAFARAFFLTKV